MELNQLRYFCEVARSQHMTRSAQRLHVAQPALSQAISRLEAELGVALFERCGRNIRLTPEGSRFYGQVYPLVEELDAAADEAKRRGRAARPLVRVGIFSASSLVVDALATYMEANPEVAFEVTQDDDRGRFDVGVRTLMPGATPLSELPGKRRVRATFSEAIGVAVPSKSGLGAVVSLHELGDERFVRLVGSRCLTQLCDRLCGRYGFHPTIGFNSDNPSVVNKMIALGLGVGFWPQFSWGSLEGTGARWVRLREEGCERVLAITDSAEGRANEAARVFGSFLEEYVGRRWE